MDRPRAHFTPRTGWVNDPYGVWWDGQRYHLYFQAVPDAVEWAPQCSWGHAVSTDLVRWEEQPLALRPRTGEVGCWSGCVVDDEAGRLLAFYTSVRGDDLERGAVAVVDLDATGRARPDRSQVVIAAPPEGLGAVAFRDPFVRRCGDGWQLAVGGGLADGSGCVFSYRSDDLRAWRYTGLLDAGQIPDLPGRRQVWECPQLLSVSGRDLLVVSVQVDGIAGPVVAATARRGQPFGSWQRLVHGSIGYATSLFLDRDGRPAMLSWLREQHPPAEPRDWAGAESVVAILDVAAHGGVVLQPHPAVADAAVFAEMPLPGSPAVVAEEPATPQVFTAPPDCAVDLRVGIGGTEALALATTPDRSGLIVRTAGQIERLPASAPEAGLRLFLDGDLAELFWAGSYGAWRLPG